MSGESNFEPARGFEDAPRFVGDYKDPLWFGTAKDMKSELLTDDFYTIFSHWRMHHAGFGFSDGRPWGEQDPLLVDNMLAMQEYFDSNFNPIYDIKNILYTKIKPALFAGFKLKER